ncbi:sulfatase family protein [Persicirhabdus sediminis]|uniref:Sulfatase-like hydrolase/transferase n=1 Tax=Persicirhabdus sediminis TaxID=454144 RepID=A0A8J7SMQ4_9BACT|nr:sulfatase-like hydrolase/transferase [Persicirhabdus sediminis]MBK1792220.1 sulfatase-like hydrolase/transferase [Persicirhabdus sediminis]
MNSITKGILTLGAAALGCASVQAAESKPNFIIILIDDMGYDDIGYMGADDIYSPNIDKMAAEGTHFTQGYVTSSVCGPSRAGLITGRYQDRFGVIGNFGGNAKQGLPTGQPMIQELLKPAGYTTGAIGKWHFGHAKEEYKPWNREFDYFFGFMAGGHDYFEAKTTYDTKVPHWPIHRNEGIVNYKKGDYLTDVFSKEAVDFIDRNHDKPFFLYLAYNAIHHPWVATPEHFERAEKLHTAAGKKFDHDTRHALAAMTLSVDDGVGAIAETLKKHGIDDNTAIFFLSDNGYQSMPRRMNPVNNAGLPAKLRGFKGDTYEGGIRVPYFIKWPGVVPAGKQYNEPVISLDMVPTMMSHLGLEAPKTGFDGVNIVPFLDGTNNAKPHDKLFFRYVHDIAYRKGDWVLTWNDQEKSAGQPASKGKLDMKKVSAMLFNLKDDVEQQNDLRQSNPEKFEELYKEYKQLMQEIPEEEFPRLTPSLYTIDNIDSL